MKRFPAYLHYSIKAKAVIFSKAIFPWLSREILERNKNTKSSLEFYLQQ